MCVENKAVEFVHYVCPPPSLLSSAHLIGEMNTCTEFKMSVLREELLERPTYNNTDKKMKQKLRLKSVAS